MAGRFFARRDQIELSVPHAIDRLFGGASFRRIAALRQNMATHTSSHAVRDRPTPPRVRGHGSGRERRERNAAYIRADQLVPSDDGSAPSRLFQWGSRSNTGSNAIGSAQPPFAKQSAI